MRRLLAAGMIGVLPALAIAADGLEAAAGRALFKRQWIPAPSSTIASDGLGPLFNARSCATCHAGGHGGRVVDRDGRRDLIGAVVRLGDADGKPDPTYGLQVQTDAVPGLAAEAHVRFLPKLSMRFNYGQLAPQVHAGVRIAPSLIGRAAIDGINDEEIRRHADPEDRDGDGIRGRVREVEDIAGSRRPGRFGWKAAEPSLDAQVANAFMLDIGLSSPLYPKPAGDCTASQTTCIEAPNGRSAAFDGEEISAAMIGLVGQYLASLPLRAATDLPGLAVFNRIGCAACHVSDLKNRTGETVQIYSDLLLHDMGAGLDDGVGEPGAASRDWRTAPLIDMKAPGRRYLHDGRAATLSSAVRWHDGEAQQARQRYDALNAADRQHLIEFLERL